MPLINPVIKEMLSIKGIMKFLDGHPTQTEFYTKWYWMYASVGQVIKDSKLYDINGANADGDTPLMLAIKCKRNIMILNTLMHMGADVHATNKQGKTAYDIMQTTYRWRTSQLYYKDFDIYNELRQATTVKHV